MSDFLCQSCGHVIRADCPARVNAEYSREPNPCVPVVDANEIERLRARVAELEHTLKDVAAVAHFGGLVRMMEPEALVVIRKLTIAHSGGLDHGDKSTVSRLNRVRAL